MARQTITPLDWRTKLVNPDGTPSPQFIRLWQQLFGNDSQNNSDITTKADKGLIENSGLTMASNRLLGRQTAGTGAIEELTLSEALDFIGSAAQGDILYRDASAWARLPAGTSGQFLQTQGAAANPQWATASGGGSAEDFSWPTTCNRAFSGSAYASKGVSFYLGRAYNTTGIAAIINGTAGHTYQAGVYAFSTSTNLVTSVTATSSTKVLTSTGTQIVAFEFTASLAANTAYYVGIQRTDGGDTFINPIMGSGSSANDIVNLGLPIVPGGLISTLSNNLGRIAKASPTVGDTVDYSTTNGFFIGIKGYNPSFA